jgi:hypothetical protein
MVKGIGAICLFFLCTCVFAGNCSKAAPPESVAFCSTFKVAATCYCTSSGLPSGMCQDLEALYKRMISVFGDLKTACQYQRNTTTQDCIDSWNCYRVGGKTSQNKLCSSTGKKCA